VGHQIIDSLVSKYGAGTVTSDEQSKKNYPIITHLATETDKKEIRWTFPSTIIVYGHNFYFTEATGVPGGLNLNTITIKYIRNEASKL